MPTFLQLSPEQGGTRFGPFPSGVIQLGSSAAHCQIVLHAQGGIAPVHASITAMGGGRFTVQPTQQGLGLFLVQRGQTHLWPVEAPITASAGDRLILGTQTGPSFALQWEEDVRPSGPIAAGPVARGPAGVAGPAAGAGLASGIGAEMQRQAFAKMLGRAGPARDLYHLYHRYRSGALSNPRVLVSILGTVAVGVFTLATGCAGVFAAMASKFMGG